MLCNDEVGDGFNVIMTQLVMMVSATYCDASVSVDYNISKLHAYIN
jgi:hypothetical protein